MTITFKSNPIEKRPTDDEIIIWGPTDPERLGHSILFIVVISTIFYFSGYNREERIKETQMILLGGILYFILQSRYLQIHLKGALITGMAIYFKQSQQRFNY